MNSGIWNVIINPNSGNFKPKTDQAIIKDLFRKYNLNAEFHLTESRNHAEQLSYSLTNEGFTNFAVAGGDGTLNEVVNGIFSKDGIEGKITLAMIPVGSGNDWCRTFKIPQNYEKSVRLISESRVLSQDIGKISFEKGNTRFFANVADIGFGAEVAYKVNEDKLKHRHNKIVYLKNLLFTLAKINYPQLKMEIDKEFLTEEVFSIAIGIGKYNGGGMMQTPDSIFDDGLFDITIIKKISRFDVILQIKNLFDGSFVSHKAVKRFRAKHIKIESESQIAVEGDGESAGWGNCSLDILPSALNVVHGLG